MTERVKVYEEKKAMAVWMWLLPLLLLLGVLAYLLTRHHNQPSAASASPVAPVAQTAAVAPVPDLGTVHFDTNKATLTPEGQAALQQAAAAMKANPNVHLRIEGFTDSTGSASHNHTLSDQRARTVVDYLQSQGIDRSRLTGQGFAAAKQVETNETAQGKADNRRVELFSTQQ